MAPLFEEIEFSTVKFSTLTVPEITRIPLLTLAPSMVEAPVWEVKSLFQPPESVRFLSMIATFGEGLLENR
jgi:hypothetical protein